MKNTSLRGGTTKQSPAITERPILFQTEMVKAILEGRKKQTRREIKNIEIKEGHVNGTVNFECKKKGFYEAGINVSTKKLNLPFVGIIDLCKYGKPGDLLWVRETWAPALGDYAFKADYSESTLSEPRNKGLWKPSIHMPKSASRIWLMIEDIRVERVQEISEKDARAEGLSDPKIPSPSNFKLEINKGKTWATGDHFFVWKSLWISINGKESWNAKPWVWVIQFRVLSTTGKPSDEVIQQNLSDLSASAVNQEKEVTNG